MIKFFYAKIHISIELISKTLINKRRNHLKDIRDMSRYAWVYIGTFYTECIHYFKIAIDITISNYVPCHAFTIRCINNLVVYISEVLYIRYFISYMFHVATNYIPRYKRTSITNMRMIIWCHTTNIHLCFTWCYRSKYLFLARHCIINCNFSHRY